jgi:hypothetical protein
MRESIYLSTLILAFCLVILVLLVPRRYIMLPFILCACFIPADQRQIIMDLDFTPLRMLILVVLVWMFLSWPSEQFRLRKFDILVLTWGICWSVVYCLQWGTGKAIIHQSGIMFDTLGMYLIFTRVLNSWGTVRVSLKIFAFCAIATAVLIAWEQITGDNLFAVLGKVHTVVREGRYRYAGPFPHSIMCGLFWGLLAPLFIGIVITERKKLLYSVAVAACVFIVFATASSTPLLALLIVLAGVLVFKLRRYTQAVGWGFVLLLVGLHLIMKAPVWHLLSRVDVIVGSDGWHRFHLVDEAIRHFKEWALLGCRDTGHWGWGLLDVTNEYIFEGVRGGFATLALLVVILFVGFRVMLRCSFQENTFGRRFLSWCFFVSLFGHSVAFMVVSYFGQMTMQWYMMLAIIGFMSERLKQHDTVLERVSTVFVPVGNSSSEAVLQ